MEFKLLNKSELKGTVYYEFLPGNYKDKCWNDYSVYMNMRNVCVIEDLLYKVNKEYGPFEFTRYNKDQIKTFKYELSKRLGEIHDINYKITGVFNEKYYNELNKDVDEYRNEIIEMLEDFSDWLKSMKEDEMYVLGI